MRKIFFSLSLLLVLQACIKEEFNPNIISTQLKLQPAVAVPIGYMDMTLDKYLSDSLKPEQLTQDSAGFFTLLYQQNVFSLRADELLSFNNPISQSDAFSNTTGLNIDLNLLPQDIVYSDTLKVNLNFDSGDSARIDSLILQSALIDFQVKSSQNINGELQIKIPQLTKNGIIYSKTTQINGFNTSSQLADYKLSPTFSNDSNEIDFIITATIKKSNVVIPDGAEIVNYTFTLSKLDYSVIYGYLGKQVVNFTEQTFNLPFFEKIKDGSFHFENPKLKLLFENSFGFPLSLAFTKFEATTKNSGTMQVSGSSFPLPANPYTISYPNLQQIGQNIEDSLVFSPKNTNLFTILEASPKQIDFSAIATANLNTSAYNFILDSSKLNLDVQIELPMYGNASFLVVQDTLNFQLTDFYNPQTQLIKKMSFSLDFINSFPVTIDAQIYFFDANHNLLDSMFSEPFKLPGGEDINGDGKTDPTKSESIIVAIDKDKLSRIENTHYLLNKGRIHTTNSDANPPENVKFYSDYALHTDLGAIFEFEELKY